MAFKRTLIVFTMIMLFSGIANSAEEKKFSGEGEIGLLITSGNSENESVNAKVGLKYETDHLLSEANLGALYNSEKTEIDGKKEDKVSSEKYNYAAKVGYKFDEANYIFVNAAYEDDRFSGYDYKTSYTAGYGRKLINTDDMKLDIEVGPGYRYDRTNGYLDDADNDGDGINDFIEEKTEDEVIFRGYGMFSYKLTDAASFKQDITLETGSDNRVTKSVSALKSKIMGALSMKAAFTLTHTSNPPVDKEKTDKETALTLVYDF